MTQHRSIFRVPGDWIGVSLVWLILTVTVEAQSPGPPSKAGVEVTGEFRDDGSCQVFANGAATFQTTDSAQTTYIRGATINLAPAGFDSHEIWCAPKSSEQPMLPLVASDRVFIVMLYAPTGKLAEPRSYEIRLGLPSPDTAPYRAGAALFGMSQQKFNDTLQVRIGLLYLAGTRGTVVITHVGTDRIVGTFSIHAQPALTM
jgi:hypothetical protein